MTHYRRANIAGACYFFTVNLADRRGVLLVEHVELMRAAFRHVQVRHPYTTEAITILPDHLHAIWTLPPGDADFSMRWRLIKTEFSRRLPAGERRMASRISKGERGIWQRRYWEHTLRDENDFERHCNYIHFNPMKHGYVSSASEWPYSSFQRFVRLGVYPRDWATGEEMTGENFGER